MISQFVPIFIVLSVSAAPSHTRNGHVEKLESKNFHFIVSGAILVLRNAGVGVGGSSVALLPNVNFQILFT